MAENTAPPITQNFTQHIVPPQPTHEKESRDDEVTTEATQTNKRAKPPVPEPIVITP